MFPFALEVTIRALNHALKTVASLTLKTFLVADPLLAGGRASVENVTLSPVDQRCILTLVPRYCLAGFSCLVV